jgi:hypothetical protein
MERGIDMARRKEETFPELLFQVLRRVPWWVGPVLIVTAFVFLEWLFPAIFDVPQLKYETPATPDTAMQFSQDVLRKSAAGVSRMLAPWISLLIAGVWIVALLVKFHDRRTRYGR